MKKLIYILNYISIFLVFIHVSFTLITKLFFTDIFYTIFFGSYLIAAVTGIIIYKKSKRLSILFTFLGYCFLFFQFYSLTAL